MAAGNLILTLYAQHAFGDADTSLETIREWDAHGPFPLDAPRSAGGPQGYARLDREQGIPTVDGKWPTARSEVVDLMDRWEVRELAAERG